MPPAPETLGQYRIKCHHWMYFSGYCHHSLPGKTGCESVSDGYAPCRLPPRGLHSGEWFPPQSLQSPHPESRKIPAGSWTLCPEVPQSGQANPSPGGKSVRIPSPAPGLSPETGFHRLPAVSAPGSVPENDRELCRSPGRSLPAPATGQAPPSTAPAGH